MRAGAFSYGRRVVEYARDRRRRNPCLDRDLFQFHRLLATRDTDLISAYNRPPQAIRKPPQAFIAHTSAQLASRCAAELGVEVQVLK